ncbi:MAG: DUF177 domain-containing protein [Clostridia bacterium]|nr:MAG: DUF177 domain-containing protein [Clostridia bacterium]
MELDVSALRQASGAKEDFYVQGELPQRVMDPEEGSLQGPVELSGTVANVGHILVVKGNVEATVEFICSRCLRPFARHLRLPYEEEFCHISQLHNVPPEAREGVHDFAGETVALDETIAETIILSLPMRALCREDCRGICPKCGQDLNEGSCDCRPDDVDPRLAVLSKFMGPGQKNPGREKR